jgi:serine/threonine protein kinase
LPPQLLKLKREYLDSLNEKSLLQSLDSEVNWSGKGQHVTFQPTEDVPFKHLGHLGASISATVDKVLCRRVALARKTMRCTPRFKVADALIEVSHLQKLQHFHIVQLVGSYLQGRTFSILMYPVADLHLGTFLEDTSEVTNPPHKGARYEFLSSIFGCLASAFNFIHKHSTKHMDVKPQNILVRKTLLREDWGGWRVCIADFGLSRDYTAQGHSQTDGRTSLTPRYCAPEVYSYESRGRSADIFSLGCVFLEILTVLADQHPHDFTEWRSMESDDDSFHANLYQVALWAESYFGRGISHDFCDVKIDRSVCDLVEKMVSQKPIQRPTALELDLFFRGLPEGDSCRTKADCCTRPPEPYFVA